MRTDQVFLTSGGVHAVASGVRPPIVFQKMVKGRCTRNLKQMYVYNRNIVLRVATL
jgi:hypothetical protein